MSRLARKSIAIPAGATIADMDRFVVVKGPKGELQVPKLHGVVFTTEADGLRLTRTEEDKQSRANLGTMWSLLSNAAVGVTTGFTKVLEVQGVGFRAQMEGTTLVLNIGFSHPVRFPSPEGISITVEKNLITVTGTNKEYVGQAAALIRKFKKPEPYKGKGIRYQGEVVRMKAGKKGATK